MDLKERNWRLDLAALAQPLVVLLALMGLIGIQKGQLSQIKGQGTAAEYRQDALRQQASLVLLQRLPRGSFSNLIADWSFLQFFQYFGDQPARDVTGHGLNPEFLAATVKHDPRFIDAALYMSPASSLYAGRPDRTVEILGQGLQSLSPRIYNAYWIWIYKGVDELLFLDDAVLAKNSYRMGAQWAGQQYPQSDETHRIIESSKGTIAYLERGKIGRVVRINAWLTLLGNARDDVNLQRFILGKVQGLGGKIIFLPNGRFRIQMPPETDESTTSQPQS